MGVAIESDDPRIDTILAAVKAASLKKHALLDDREFRGIVSKTIKLGNGRRPAARKAGARRNAGGRGVRRTVTARARTRGRRRARAAAR
jgi:hypothetical protein